MADWPLFMRTPLICVCEREHKYVTERAFLTRVATEDQSKGKVG